MAEVQTHAELYEAGKAEIQSRNDSLTDFVEGSVLDVVVGAGTVLADEVNLTNARRFAEQFFATAKGDALRALALDRYGTVMDRLPATAATGLVQWTRGDDVTAYEIPAGSTFRATVNGVSVLVESTADAQLLAGATSVDVPVEASVAGRSSNLAAGTITEVVSAPGVPVGEPASITNAAALAGGTEQETDEEYLGRIKLYPSTIRRGTVEALAFGARLVPGVKVVAIDETTIETDQTVRVYIGDPDANSNDDLVDAVTTELNNWRCAGVQVVVDGAEREEIDLTIEVELELGSDVDTIASAIRASVVGYGDTLGAGQAASVSRIERAVHDASTAVLACDVTSPVQTGKIEPSANNAAIRFTVGSIALVFTEIS